MSIAATFRVLTLLILGGLWCGTVQAQIVFTVNSNGDAGLSNPGLTSCNTGGTVTIPGTGSVPECTFRAALQAANNRGAPVTIEYASALACTDLLFITPQSPFPGVVNQININASTHPCEGSTFNWYPIIDGQNLPSGTSGMTLGNGASGSVIEKIQFMSFPGDGITIDLADSVILRGVNLVNPGRHGVLVQRSGNSVIVDSRIVGAGAVTAGSHGVFVEDPEAAGLILESNEIRNASGHGVNLLHGSGHQVGRNITVSISPLFIACRGNEIFSNDRGVSIGAGTTNVTVRCNEIRNNTFGVDVLSGAASVLIGGVGTGTQAAPLQGNSIHSNQSSGVALRTAGAVLEGNWIGTNLDGDVLGNGEHGIFMTGGVNNRNMVRGNVISNNSGDGVRIQTQGAADIRSNRILSNGIGVNAFRQDTFVGGFEPEHGNVIGLNTLMDIQFAQGVTSPGAGVFFVGHNYIGTDETGADLGGSGPALYIGGLVSLAFVGFTLDDGNPIFAPNVIGNREIGIRVFNSDSSVIVGSNFIGTNPQGANLGNSIAGIQVEWSDTAILGNLFGDTNVGPPGTGMGNLIANNGTGIQFFNFIDTQLVRRISMIGNRFVGNGSRGINIGPGGDVIDPGGGSDGNNGLMNFPELDPMETFLDTNTGLIHYRYRVQTNVGNATYPLRIDFYLADGNTAQGETWLATETLSSAEANIWVTGTLEPPAGVDPDGRSLTAMATDSDGNSSEFNPAVVGLGEILDEIFRDRFETL